MVVRCSSVRFLREISPLNAERDASSPPDDGDTGDIGVAEVAKDFQSGSDPLYEEPVFNLELQRHPEQGHDLYSYESHIFSKRYSNSSAGTDEI